MAGKIKNRKIMNLLEFTTPKEKLTVTKNENIQDLTKLTPSELILVALKDLEATEKAGINISMDRWGDDIGSNTCSVCLAGSVMLQKNDTDCFDDEELLFVPQGKNSNVYYALNTLRKGNIIGFLENLKKPNLSYASYEQNPKKFKQWLKNVADSLSFIE